MISQTFDAWDKAGLIGVLAFLAIFAVTLTIVAIRKDHKRNRRVGLPAPQREAMSPRHFADT